jgi:hypothetical protein
VSVAHHPDLTAAPTNALVKQALPSAFGLGQAAQRLIGGGKQLAQRAGAGVGAAAQGVGNFLGGRQQGSAGLRQQVVQRAQADLRRAGPGPGGDDAAARLARLRPHAPALGTWAGMSPGERANALLLGGGAAGSVGTLGYLTLRDQPGRAPSAPPNLAARAGAPAPAGAGGSAPAPVRAHVSAPAPAPASAPAGGSAPTPAGAPAPAGATAPTGETAPAPPALDPQAPDPRAQPPPPPAPADPVPPPVPPAAPAPSLPEWYAPAAGGAAGALLGASLDRKKRLRGALLGGGLGLGAGLLAQNYLPGLAKTGADDPGAGGAPPKTSQAQAHYGPALSAARSCALCANFDGNQGCAVVDGPVQPTGTSDLFTPRPEMAAIDPTAVSAAPSADPQGTKLGAAAQTALAGLLDKLAHYPGCGKRRRRIRPHMPSKRRGHRKHAELEKGAALPIIVPLGLLAAPLGAGAAGAYMAPKGRGEEGFLRGLRRGRLGFAGAGLGAVGGGLLGEALGAAADIPSMGTLAGAVGGAGLGAYGGNLLAGNLIGPPSWQPKGKKYNPSGLKHPRRARGMIAGAPAGLLAGGGGVTLYAKHLAGPASRVGGTFSHRKPTSWPGEEGVEDVQKTVDKVLAGRHKVPVYDMPDIGENAGYVPDLDAIAWNPRNQSGFGRGVAAHEAGHALNYHDAPTLTGMAQGLSRMGQPLTIGSTIAAPLIPSKKWALRTALLGSALQLPQLAEEAIASHRGGLGLMQGAHGLGAAGKYLSAYSGLPTYALGAALPLLAYGIAHQLGRWGHGEAPARPKLRVVGQHDGRAGRDADGDKKLDEGRRKAASLTKCACVGDRMCGACAAKKKKPYRERRPERREGDARFAWQGRGARNVTDDPGYEKYVRKSAAEAALAALSGGPLPRP